MICPFCDSQIEDGLSMCPHCNAKLQELPKEAEPELIAPETPEAQEAPEAQAEAQEAPEAQAEAQAVPEPQEEAREIPEPQEDQAAPEPQETAAEAQVLPEPLWSPEPEAEAPEAAPTLSEAEPEPVAVRKRSPKRGLLIGLGCAALAAVVGLGIWFLGRRSSPAAKLQKAAKNSIQALEDYAHRLPNLGTMVDNLKALESSQALHEQVQLLEQVRLNEEPPEGIALDLNWDLDKAAGRVGGEFAMTGEGLDLALKLYGDKTQIQMGSEGLLEDQVLALPLENLPQRWNESALGKLSGITMPTETPDPQKYSLEDLNQAFTERYGQDWTVFRESLQVAEYEGTPHFTQGVSYTLVWDQKALDAIHVKTAEVMKELEKIENPEQLLKQDMRVLLGDLVLEGFWQFSNECKDLQLLVEKELLTGFYMAEKEGSGFLELRLQGEENPWTHCTATLQDDREGSVVSELLDLTMTAAEGQLRITAKSSMLDSEGKEYEAEDGPVTLVYRDSDGNVSLEGVELGDDMEMIFRVTPVDAGASLNWELKQQMELFEGYNLENSLQINALVKGAIAASPEPLSANPTDLLGLSQAELEALVEKIGNSLITIIPITAESGRPSAEPTILSMETPDGEIRVMTRSSVQHREGQESEPGDSFLTLAYQDSEGNTGWAEAGQEAFFANIMDNCMDLVISAPQP